MWAQAAQVPGRIHPGWRRALRRWYAMRDGHGDRGDEEHGRADSANFDAFGYPECDTALLQRRCGVPQVLCCIAEGVLSSIL